MGAEPTVLVCVGATKSGTSWLYRHLRAHPDCHLRTIKELHYFDMTRPAHFADAQARIEAEIARLQPRLPDAALAGRLADLVEWRAVLARGATDLAAYRAFLLGGRADQPVVGEVTPAYGLLPLARLRQIAEVGAVKVVFLMRDPVARAWSHVRMVAARAGEGFEDRARSLLARLIAGDLSGEGRGIAIRGDYRAIVPRLKAAFAPAALHLAFYEDLLSPAGVQRLWSFLGIGPGPVDLETRVWESPRLAMTGEEAQGLRRWLAPQYDYVSGLMPQLPQAWRANMQEGLA